MMRYENKKYTLLFNFLNQNHHTKNNQSTHFFPKFMKVWIFFFLKLVYENEIQRIRVLCEENWPQNKARWWSYEWEATGSHRQRVPWKQPWREPPRKGNGWVRDLSTTQRPFPCLRPQRGSWAAAELCQAQILGLKSMMRSQSLCPSMPAPISMLQEPPTFLIPPPWSSPFINQCNSQKIDEFKQTHQFKNWSVSFCNSFCFIFFESAFLQPPPWKQDKLWFSSHWVWWYLCCLYRKWLLLVTISVFLLLLQKHWKNWFFLNKSLLVSLLLLVLPSLFL